MTRTEKPLGSLQGNKATQVDQASPPAPLTPGRSLRRWLYASVGVVCVGLAFVGVFLPGLPTTVFLILASFFFTRSCPWLEQRLVRARIFRPYLRYLDGERRMPLRARVGTIAIMWIAVGTSFAVMYSREALAPWFVAVVGGAALVGSVWVALAFRGPGAEETA